MSMPPMPFDASSDAQNNDRYEPAQKTQETPTSEVTDEQETSDTRLPIEETASEAPIDPLISTLPPEAQGETNGGPLGCCLGTVAGLFFTLALILLVSVAIGNGGYLGWTTAPAALLGTIMGGYVGWRIGKRIYREYELSPQRRERLARAEQQWNIRQQSSKRVRHPKIG